MALDSLDIKFEVNFDFTVQKSVTGFSNSILVTNRFLKRFDFALGGGADQMQELYATLLTITASGSTTLDLTAFTDAINQASQSLSTLKSLFIWLLDADDSVGGVSGTACSGVKVGAAASNAFTGPLGGTTPTFTIPAGGVFAYSNPAAAGDTVDGTHCNLKILNLDGVNSAKVLVAIGGD